MPKNKSDLSNQELLKLLNQSFSHLEERMATKDDLARVESKVDKIESRVTKIESRVTKIESRVTKIESRVTKIESQMVTKDYLDDKLADLRGDLVILMRKEDNKLKALVNILEKRRVISKTDVKNIYALEPFAQV